MRQTADRATLAAQIALKNRAQLDILAEKVRELAEKQAKSEKKTVIIPKNGRNGRDGKDGKDGQNATDEQVKSAAAAWLSANIRQPADGKDGKDGKNAQDPTAEQIQLAVDLWFEMNRESVRGEKGDKGDKGDPGKNGKDGKDGQTPEHEWRGTSIRFRRASGIWGPWVDLQGPPGVSGGGGGGSSGVQQVRAGTGITVDNTDPRRPIVSATGGAGATWVTLDGEPRRLNFISVGDDEVELELVPL